MLKILSSPRGALVNHIRKRSRGQSLVEFALILPILMTLTGAAIDVARVYGGWVALEGASRDAAEQVATDTTITTLAGAQAKAQTIVCTQLANSVGFVAPAGNPSACTSPTVVTAWSTNGAAKNPTITVTVTTTLPFRTLFAYPLLTQNGAWMLGSNQTYSIIQGR